EASVGRGTAARETVEGPPVHRLTAARIADEELFAAVEIERHAGVAIDVEHRPRRLSRSERERERFTDAQRPGEIEETPLMLADRGRIEHPANDCLRTGSAPRTADVGRLAVHGGAVGLAKVIGSDNFSASLLAPADARQRNGQGEDATQGLH